jgi:hypothetical protein
MTNKKPTLIGRALPERLVKPISLKEIDPAVLVWLRQYRPENADPEKAGAGEAELALLMEKNLRLMLLARHLGIEVEQSSNEQGWQQLAMRLAEELVPGLRIAEEEAFQPRRARGRPKGGGMDQRRLCKEVESLVASGHTVSGACLILAKRREWRETAGRAETVKARAASLEATYYRYKREAEREESARLLMFDTYFGAIKAAGGLDGYMRLVWSAGGIGELLFPTSSNPATDTSDLGQQK